MAHAKYCQANYPTIVNLIPKEKNQYNNTLKDFATVDNKLQSSQLGIGLSSNLAQLCLTYTYNFEDKKYKDYVCILSVLAQICIDNAKRTFDIDTNKEIDLIKKDMNIEENGLPLFWQITKKDKRKCSSEEEKKKRRKVNKEKIKAKLNEELVCPMNYLYGLDLDKHRSSERTIPIKEFLELDLSNNDRRKSKAVEELIEKYALDLYVYMEDESWKDLDSHLFMSSEFDNLIRDIQKIYISRNYKGLMSWLINRAFKVSAGVKRNTDIMDSRTDKNKSLLIKVLYTINKDVFMSCFKSCTLDKNERSQTQ